MTSPLRLLWLVSFPVETGAGWLLLGPHVWVSAFALHVVATIFFGLSLIVWVDGRRNWTWSVLGWTLSLLLFPILGMLSVLVAFVSTRVVRPRSDRQTATELEETPGTEESAEDMVTQARKMEISLLEEREVEPVVDVLQEDDPESKRAAIEMIARRRGAGSVLLLRGLLHDPSPEARFFASISLSKLEDEIGKAILAAQRDLAENPKLPEARERLAEAYKDYVLSGFLEGATRDFYLELTCQALEAALETSLYPDRIALDLARMHLMLGNIAHAVAILDDLAYRQPDDADVHLVRMEVIYEFGDFRELSVYAQRVLSIIGEGSEWHDLVEWWSSTNNEETLRDT